MQGCAVTARAEVGVRGRPGPEPFQRFLQEKARQLGETAEPAGVSWWLWAPGVTSSGRVPDPGLRRVGECWTKQVGGVALDSGLVGLRTKGMLPSESSSLGIG